VSLTRRRRSRRISVRRDRVVEWFCSRAGSIGLRSTMPSTNAVSAVTVGELSAEVFGSLRYFRFLQGSRWSGVAHRLRCRAAVTWRCSHRSVTQTERASLGWPDSPRSRPTTRCDRQAGRGREARCIVGFQRCGGSNPVSRESVDPILERPHWGRTHHHPSPLISGQLPRAVGPFAASLAGGCTAWPCAVAVRGVFRQ